MEPRAIKSYYEDGDVFYFDFREEDTAQDFLARLRDILKEYSFVTVEDALKAAEFETAWVDKFEGWGDLSNATIYPCTEIFADGGFEVMLPGMKRLEDWQKRKTAKPQVDMVNHPAHYKSETGLETIEVIEAFTFDLKGVESYDVGNIIKYISRWKKKNGLQDLKKAQWYLNHLINHVEKLEEENKKYDN